VCVRIVRERKHQATANDQISCGVSVTVKEGWGVPALGIGAASGQVETTALLARAGSEYVAGAQLRACRSRSD